MTADRARYAPSEIELEVPCGTFLFRLPPVQIAKIQEARAIKISYPDGGVASRPKAIGTIIREHLQGVGGAIPELIVDSYYGDYDLADSREVVIQAFIGGGRGTDLEDKPVLVDEAKARRLVIDHFDPMPLEEKWKLATAILISCARGYIPPAKPGDEDAPPGNADAAGTETSSSTSPPQSGTSPSSDKASTDS